jgi:hypothetical protein
MGKNSGTTLGDTKTFSLVKHAAKPRRYLLDVHRMGLDNVCCGTTEYTHEGE